MKKHELYEWLLENSDAFLCADKETRETILNKEFDKYVKKLKKKSRYMEALKNWKLKEKVRTKDKIVFYISCLVQRFWDIYFEGKLFKKLSWKIKNDDLLRESIKEAEEQNIFSEKKYVINRIKEWHLKWYSAKWIYSKFLIDWYTDKDKIERYLKEYFLEKKNKPIQKISISENAPIEESPLMKEIKLKKSLLKNEQYVEEDKVNDNHYDTIELTWKITMNSTSIAFIKKTLLRYKLSQLWERVKDLEREDDSSEEYFKAKQEYYKKKNSCLWTLQRKWWYYNDIKEYFETIEN